MIMGDGSLSKGSGLILNFQSYTVKELILLMNVFKIKWDLDCTLHKSRNKYVIYIRSRSMPILYKGISPYLIPSMHYKFHKKILEIGCPAEGGWSPSSFAD